MNKNILSYNRVQVGKEKFPLEGNFSLVYNYFDMLIIPNKDHNLYDHKFFTRKRWDYFVKNLMGKEPPSNYEIGIRFKQD